MAEYLIQGETLTNITDRIRDIMGNDQTTYLPEEIPQAINDVYSRGHSAGYDEGHTDGWNEGFDEGLAQGGGGGLHHLLLEQIQSEKVININANLYCYDVGIFGSSIDYDSTFDDYVEREYSSLSSNPLTISVDNYSDFYLYLYLRVKDMGNDEQYLPIVIVPPGWNNSVDVTSHLSMNDRTDWKTEIIGARFTKYEL